MTVSMQPTGDEPKGFGWADKFCPPGLEYLTQVDQLLVKQKVELFEVFTGWETRNRFVIANSLGQQCYYAEEESTACMRQCCGGARGFTMHISDNAGQEVMRLNREFKCCAGCCWCANSDCCAFELSVEAPVGNIVGYVRQAISGWAPHYEIFNADREKIFTSWGPCCPCQAVCCTDDVIFNMYVKDSDEPVARVSKQWVGVAKEMITDADSFGISFPVDLDVKMKATLLGATFLIDYMFFEQSQNNG